MKKATTLLAILFCLSGHISAQTDSLQAHRYITRTTSYGIGHTNILDTYLSPQSYKGIEARLLSESMKMTKLFDGNVSSQNLFQANVSYTHNQANNNNAFSGLINWNYGLHYQFRITDNLKLLAGAMSDVNCGFIYNLRNSNNPASAKAYVNLAASTMAIYRFKIKNYPIAVRYQANIPFIGAMFSPNYDQSYYEIFSLGNSKGVIKLTSLGNQPSIRQQFSIDLPISYYKLRISYLCDIQQSSVNQLRTHTYSNIFMFGMVKDILTIRNKKGTPLPSRIRAY